MANYVNFYLCFEQINEAATAKLNEMYSRIRTDNERQWFSDMFVEGDLTYEESSNYSWTIDNIGPKWAYLDDFDEVSLNGVSAWSAPEAGVEKLLSILEEFDPNIISYLTYEDEMPNFFGANVYEGSGIVDCFEEDFDEIRQRVVYASERLTEDSWSEDDCEWVDDDAAEAFNDELWEVISDAQMSLVHETLEMIKEERKANES